MKKFLLTLCLLMGYATLHAASVSDLEYSISNGKVTITDCSSSASGELIIPSTLDGYPVTTIWDRAFYCCSSLTSVTIPSSVTLIDWRAFEGCSSLTSVTLPSSITRISSAVFQGCSSLTEITIPENVAWIEPYAFQGCTSLTSVTIPKNVTSIMGEAFQGCTSLTSVTIPENVTNISNSAFGACTNLKEVTFHCKKIYVDDAVFDGVMGLEKLVFTGETVKFDYEHGVFNNRKSLKTVLFPKTMKELDLGKCLFLGCSSLEICELPESVEKMNLGRGYTFSGCSNLKSITLAPALTSIPSGAFQGCSSLTEITIPESVTSVGSQAFEECIGLTEITIPTNVTSLGADAFKNCSALEYVTFLGAPPSGSGNVTSTLKTGYYLKAHEEAWAAVWNSRKQWRNLQMASSIEITASDGSEVGGVLVEWTEIPNATYTLWRGEKRGEKTELLFSGPSTEYFDETADSNTCYYYTVEATQTSGISLYSTQNNGITASDSGYHDNALFPNIEKIELPDFWLEDRAPLAITWNNYDDKKFRVSLCKVTLVGPSDRSDEISVQEIKPKGRVVFDIANDINAKLCKPFSDNDFGNHQVVVTWEVEELKGGIWWTKIQHNLKKTADKNIGIFFNKYERNNWYYFWPKTGAIAKGYIGDDGIFEYDPRLEGRGLCSLEYAKLDNKMVTSPMPKFLPNIYYASPYSREEYFVGRNSPTRKTAIFLDETSTISKDAIGLEVLALVLAHEWRHGELSREYCNGVSENKPLIATPRVKCSVATMEELVEICRNQIAGNMKKYGDTILEIYNDGKGIYTSDLDGDTLLDEKESAYGLILGNPDTYDLKNKKDHGYATYGDNEYLAIKAETESTVNFYPSKDWAFPGTNCYPLYSGLTKTEWDARKGEILADVFGDFEATTSTRSKGSSMKAYSAVALASEEEESSRMGGDLTRLPSLYEFAGEGLSIEGDILDQTADYAVGNGYSALAISIPFVNNSGEAISAAEVSGYLVNEKDEPVAVAQMVADIPTGKTNVTLEFPGDSLQKIKSATYRLALVQVMEISGDLGMTTLSKTELTNNTFAYTNAQFTGNAVNYLYNTFSEEKTQEGLQVEVKGIITIPGVYHLEARLEGADGDLVSHVGYEQEFTAGEMTASFVFPNEEIYLSRQNGPYDICFVRISQDGVVLDERRMPYQTSTYSYTDFTPENVCLVIDESSFKRGDDVVGTDGLITNLSFSFDVDYQGEEDVQYQGRLSLYGENDTIVAVSQETFSLVKGRNTLEFLVDGYSIQKSGINGPYYVKGVLLEPQNGAAETFAPTMAPIELNSEDFGTYPFGVSGDVRFSEHSNGYDLIVPLEIMRANTVTVSAMLVDSEERCAATAKVSKTYTSPTAEEIVLTFNNADIAESELDGYKVRFIQIQTDIPNLPAASVSLPTCIPTYEIVNGEVFITGCTFPIGTLEIPATIAGYPVTTIADGAFYECTNLTSITIPSSVTSIGDRAFEGCSGLTSVLISEGVTAIGDWAFYNCYALVSVTLPSSVKSIGVDAFCGVAPKTLTAPWLPSGMSNVNLGKVIIPEGVTSIESYAFADCTELTAVTIPEGVTSIGSYAFANCSGLTGVMIPMSVTLIGVRAFYGCQSLTTLVIPEGVTSIKDSAFAYCSGLTSAAIPSSVNTIGNYAFYYCTSLTSVTISKGVTSIGSYAFRGCSGLTSVSIPKGVTSIGSYAFANCSKLASVTLSSSVTSIGNHAFYYCTGLTAVTIPEGVSEIGDSAFERCVSLPSVIIPKGVTRINSRVFAHCDQLVTLIIPESVTEIRDRAIMDCHNLPAITIPAKVTTISDYCFGACYKLKLITIPEEVTTIGEAAFIRCEGLTSIDFEGVPPSALDSAFSGVSARGYYLPKHAVAWKAVLDANGTWNGLMMEQKAVATLPEGLPGATGAWLTDILEAQDVTSGSVTLASGTTAETLEAARLLGITPRVDGTEVAVASTFEVSEVVVADNAVSLAVTITVEAGELPENPSLGGTVKLLVCDTLGGEWTEVTPDPSQIKLTRISDTEARLSVTQSVDAYNFFKVVVK